MNIYGTLCKFTITCHNGRYCQGLAGAYTMSGPSASGIAFPDFELE